MLFAAQYAAVQLWKSFGVEPAAVIGEGDGEYAAACVAGVFSLEECLRIVGERGRLVWSAALPSPEALEAWLDRFRDCLHAFRWRGQAAVWIDRRWTRRPMLDTGRAMARSRATSQTPSRGCYRRGYCSFLEVGPNPALSGRARLCLPAAGALHLTSPVPGQDDWSWIAHTLAELYVHGGQVNWAEVTKGALKRTLPTYPFERRSYWYSPAQLEELSAAGCPRSLRAPSPAHGSAVTAAGRFGR